ncbi:MAG TPA: deoxynucleoside kinase [Chloroflexi bacterium]|nr:deoxynucleoside kinase [Anaerolineales bacterium]HDN04490.1 deoxynucleoside kinase [Chloroflexota bacterium]
MSGKLVLVAGNIGTGKTSLTERLGDRLGWCTAYESVIDNPYLGDFYQDMDAWSFHLQVYFLGHRAQQHLELVSDNRSAIADRSIYEDVKIFARALYHQGSLSERDYRSYQRVFQLIADHLPEPDLLIYLIAPPEILQKRIEERGRAIESGISLEYLTLLDSFYDDWMKTFNLCPVLKIRSDDLDFVHKKGHLDTVANLVQEKLTGKEEIVF